MIFPKISVRKTECVNKIPIGFTDQPPGNDYEIRVPVHEGILPQLSQSLSLKVLKLFFFRWYLLKFSDIMAKITNFPSTIILISSTF